MESFNRYFPIGNTATIKTGQYSSGKIQAKFANFYVDGGFQFIPQSTEEEAFWNEIQSLGIAHLIRKTSIVLKSLQDLDDDYCYLNPIYDREYIPGAFIDYENPCYSGDGIICFNGAPQIKKIVINTKKSKIGNDIMCLYNLPNPIIISKRLRNLIKDEVASGIAFVPCLDERMTFTVNDIAFDEPVPHLEEDALFYQLIVTNELNYPVICKNVKIFKRCPRCKTVQAFYDLATREDITFLERIDNPPFDFTLCRTFLSDNEGEFKIANGIVLVSRRIVQLFETQKIKGIEPYSKKHKASPYQAMPVRR